MEKMSFKNRVLAGILAFATIIGIVVATNLVSFADEKVETNPVEKSELDESLENSDGSKEIKNDESQAEKPQQDEGEEKKEDANEKKSDSPKADGLSIKTRAAGTGKASYTLGTAAGQVSSVIIKAGDPKNVTIKGSITSATANEVVIDIEAGWGGKVTLNGVDIKSTTTTGTPMRVQGNGSNAGVGASDTVEIALVGNNVLYSSYGVIAGLKAALETNPGSKIIITGPVSATLEATSTYTRAEIGQGAAAGIGSSNEQDHGHIIINGGTITANAGWHGAGIGAAWRYQAAGDITTGNIIIYGKDPLNPVANPVVYSNGGDHGAGIGGGCWTSGSGQVVVLGGAAVTSVSVAPGKGGLGMMAGYFFISSTPTTQGNNITPKLTINTDKEDKNIPLFLDLSGASAYWETIQLIPEAHRPIAEIKASDGTIIHDGKLTMDMVPFGTTGSTGKQERFVHITAGNIDIKTPLGTPAGDSYYPYKIVSPIIGGGADVTATLLTPVYEPRIELVTPGLGNIDYDYKQSDIDSKYNLYKIYNGNGTLDNIIKGLEVIISNNDDYIWTLVDASGNPLSGTYPTTLNKGEIFYIKQSIKPGKEVGAYDGYITFKGEDKVSGIDGNTYPTVQTYDPATHDLSANEPYEKAAIEFSTNVNKLNITTQPNDYFDLKVDKDSGKINLQGGTLAEANGVTKNEVVLSLTEKTTKLTNQTTKYRIVDGNGNPVPGQTWVDFTDGTIVSFPDDGKYKIEVEINSDQVNFKQTYGVYDVDITKPKVSSITHTPDDSSTVGYIDRTPTKITVKFDEAMTGLPEDAIKISSNIKINSITPTAVPGEYVVEMQVLPGIKEKDEITFEILGKKSTDLFYNDNISSADSGASLQPSGKLIFKQGDPTAYIKDHSDGVKFVEKLDKLEVAIVAAGNDNQGLYKADRTTPIDINDAKNFIVVKDKKTGLALPASEYQIENFAVNPEYGADVTIKFPSQLDSGDYVVEFNKDVIYNKEGKTIEDSTFNFKIKRPVVDGATLAKDAFDQKGGKLTITIDGEHLTEVETIVVKDNKGNKYPVTIVKDDQNKVIITLPENKNFDNDEIYTFDIYINEGTGLDTEAIIPVKKPGETGTHTKVVVDRAKTIINFNLNGADTPASIPPIVQDKDANGGNFDFTEYDYKQPKQPIKKDHMFVGWYLGDKRITNILELADINGKGGEYTLTAKWIDMTGLTKPPTEPGKPGDPSKPVVPGDGSSGGTVTEGPNGEIITEVGGIKVSASPPVEDTSKYPGENSKAEIEKEFGGEVEVILPDGSILDKSQPEFVWDNDDVNEPGVKEVTVYITNPQTGEKVEQKQKIYVYIVREPYISNKSLVVFEYGQQVDIKTGSAWNPMVIEEIADEETKTIVNKIHRVVIFDSGAFNTIDPGMYTVGFSATIITHKDGISKVVPPTIAEALVKPRDLEGEQMRAAGVAEQKFWVAGAEIQHLAKPGEIWTMNASNYLTGGEKSGTMKPNKNYNILVKIDAAGYPRMSSEILQILKEQTNSQLEVTYGDIKWVFHSKDFKGYKTEPTGYYDIGVKTGNNNEGINKLVGSRAQQQLEFDMNKDLIGKTTISVKLSDSLKNSKNINLFNYNAGAKQLELVGKMTNNGDGTASIKLSEIRGSYVMLSGLSKSAGTKSTTEKVLGYRITEKTNEMTASYKSEVEKDLKSSGKTIKSITALDADEKTLARIEAAQESKLLLKENRLNTIGAITGVAIVLIAIAAYVVLSKKDSWLAKKEEK